MTVPPKKVQRARDYKQTFLESEGKPTAAAVGVLADLREFCFGQKATLMYSPQSGMIDPLASVAAAARQEVWFRIIKELGLNENEVMSLHRQYEEPVEE